MGLLAVPKFLKDKYRHLYHSEHLSRFAHCRVFVDIASYLYKFVCTMGCSNSRWMNAFANLMITFRKNGVIVVPVFDGQAPPAKQEEQKARRELRAKLRERCNAIREAIQAYEQKQHTAAHFQLLQTELKNIKGKVDMTNRVVSLLHKPSNPSNHLSPSTLQDLKNALFNMERQCSSLSSTDLYDLKDMLQACGITYIQAPEESEAYCCWLVRNGFGTAVVSCDTDCIAHRGHIIVFDVDLKSGDIKYVNTQELLDAWEIEADQAIDFGILVGCDYNPGSRVNKIGPVTAIKLLKQHGNIDNIPNLPDKPGLQHEMIRDLFNPTYDTNICIEAGSINHDSINALCQRRPDVDKKILLQLCFYHSKKPIVKTMD